MSGINEFILLGNGTRDPELRRVQNGQTVPASAWLPTGSVKGVEES